jgi:hypothetical protein
MFAFSKEGWDAGWDRLTWVWFAVALVIMWVYLSIPGHQHDHTTLLFMVLCGIGYRLLHWAKSGFEKGMQMVPEPKPLPETLAELGNGLRGWNPTHDAVIRLRLLLMDSAREGKKRREEIDRQDLEDFKVWAKEQGFKNADLFIEHFAHSSGLTVDGEKLESPTTRRSA